MSALAIVGAGPGLGASVARHFGREGFSVALISRNQGWADALASELEEGGVTARGFSADVRDPRSLSRALEEAGETLGSIEVLQYSPVPQKNFMRPVLEMTPADLVGPVEFSIYGPVAAVHQVLPGMRFLGNGTILFVNGGSAIRPSPGYAGTSIAFAGESAYAQMLHEALSDTDIHVGQLIVDGAISQGDPETDPDVLADLLWNMHRDRGQFRRFAREPEA